MHFVVQILCIVALSCYPHVYGHRACARDYKACAHDHSACSCRCISLMWHVS